MTTDEYFDLWLKEQEGKIKARTLNRYAELIATHIKPSFEGVPIKKVTKDMIERYVAEYLQAQAGLAQVKEGLPQAQAGLTQVQQALEQV